MSHVTTSKNQTFMVVGAAGELPKPPPQPVVFLEGALFVFYFIDQSLMSISRYG